MLLLLSALTVQAAPAGYAQFDTEHGCTFYKGPAGANGYSPIRAECTWPDVDPTKMDQLLSVFEDHDLYFSSVAKATVTGQADGGTLVHQTHVASGISDREADLVYKRSVSGETITHSWTMTASQSAAASGNVVAAQDDGFWTITPDGNGGAIVVYELTYDPSGSVPGFVVRAFQTGGLVTLVGEMRSYVLAH